MKRVLNLLLFCMMSTALTAQVSQSDRDFAIKYLQTTHENIVAAVADLPDETFNAKPNDGGWSVSNCLEHILLTEAMFTQMMQTNGAKGTPDPELDLSAGDAWLIGGVANRGTKAQTAEPFEPTGKWESKEAMLEALETSRMNLKAYLSTTEDDLRHISADTPMGKLDLYQLALVIAAHSQRHLFQMQEVLAEVNS